MTFTARKVFKQMYPATHNFKDEADGTSGEDIGWIDSEIANDSTYSATIVASEDGHRKVIKFLAAGDNGKYAQWKHTETETADTKEFLVKYKDNGVGHFNFIGVRTSDNTTIIEIYLHSDDNKLYYLYGDGAGGTTTGSTAAAPDIWHHIELTYSCATDTYSLWLNGELLVDEENFRQDYTATSISYFRFQFDDGAGANALEAYMDAYGEASDTDYNIGDNIHYRHFKESTDSFEGDDVGTQGTSITYVDSVDTAASFEIVQEFNAHKKILRGYYSSAVGGSDYCYHAFASQVKTGWFSTLMKVSDATIENKITLTEEDAPIIIFRINGDKFQIYTGGAYRDVTGAPVPTDDTWYLIYIQWYDAATDTFDLWIDNIQYEAGTNCVGNQTSGINRCYITGYSATEYLYLDAPISSLDGDERADNRTFDYHPLSYNDITTSVFRATVNDVAYQPSAAFITGISTLSIDANHIIQLYDENNDLRFEGDFTRDILRSIVSEYPLVSLNEDELEVEVSYTAPAAEDVNATLLGNFTNVDQTDGRLIYYTEDDPAGNLTPNYRNKPNNRVIKGCAIHGGKYGIIKANGVICLDDDRVPANGAATITEISGEIIGNPKIDITDLQFNYVLVRGAINPDTGAPFYGVSEDTIAQTMSGIKRLYKRYRELQSNIDCQNKAINIRTGSGFTPTIINVQLKSIYALPGEIINFAYSYKSFSATDCYVEEVSHNLVTGVSSYRLNTGIFDRASMNEPSYTYADEVSDDINETLHRTDINTVYPELYALAGSGSEKVNDYVIMNADNEGVGCTWSLSPYIDDSRPIYIMLSFNRVTVDVNTVDGVYNLSYADLDGGALTGIEIGTEQDCPGGDADKYETATITVPATDVHANSYYKFSWVLKEAARDVRMVKISIIYFMKRSV